MCHTGYSLSICYLKNHIHRKWPASSNKVMPTVIVPLSMGRAFKHMSVWESCLFNQTGVTGKGWLELGEHRVTLTHLWNYSIWHWNDEHRFSFVNRHSGWHFTKLDLGWWVSVGTWQHLRYRCGAGQGWGSRWVCEEWKILENVGHSTHFLF